MFWCISITNNVKLCKKINEKAETGKITVFTMVNQHCGAKNKEKQGKLDKLNRKLLKIFKYYTPSRGFHVKADVLTISEMWYFLGVALFKGELLLLKVIKREILGPLAKRITVTKKKTRPQF